MSGFAVPFSSSPPSTPDSRKVNGYGHDLNPSTTPAGPPPSSTASLTPAGLPPSSLFGSSQLEPSKRLFRRSSDFLSSFSSPKDPKNPFVDTHRPLKTPPKLARAHFSESEASNFARSNPSKYRWGENSSHRRLYDNDELIPDQHVTEEEEEEEEHEEDEEEGPGDDDYSRVSEQSDMDVELDGDNQLNGVSNVRDSVMDESLIDFGDLKYSQNSSLSHMGTPRGIKRSRGGTALSQSTTSTTKGKIKAPRNDSSISILAKDMVTQFGVAKLDEPDDLILRTDTLVSQLYASSAVEEEQEKNLDDALPLVSEGLTSLWQAYHEEASSKSPTPDGGIGPSNDAPALQKAIYLALLLLQLHHPPAAKGKQFLATSQPNRRTLFSSSSGVSSFSQKPSPIPKVLIDWLDEYHCPFRIAINNFANYQPNPTAHLSYWDILLSLTLRGQVFQVLKIFINSDFRHAYTAREDGLAQYGYHGILLGNIQRVVDQAIQLLKQCPALQDGDWQVTGNEWQIFRKRVEQTMRDLAVFSEGRDRDVESIDTNFEAPNFGIKSPSTALSKSARQIESQVPWTVYQNLKAMYGIMLGGTSEILASSQDFVDATLALTIWWDGSEDHDEVSVGSLAITRRSLRQSQARSVRLVDVNPTTAYLQRLSYGFELATDDSDETLFQVSPVSPVEVGLASVFEGNIDDVLSFLRAWSLPVAAAIVELGSMAGWYESPPGLSTMNGFNETDLMILSNYEQPERRINRDGVLIDYAEALAKKEFLRDSRRHSSSEGWEMAIGTLTRLDETALAHKKVGDLLNHVPLRTDKRVDRILGICLELGMRKEAQSIAERYADSIVEESDRYGTAIIYYSRARCKKKLKDVLDLLISLSLVQSVAFPPGSSLDQNLHALIFSPQISLDQLAEFDQEAVGLLHFYLTGYATLRKFYDLRDRTVSQREDGQPVIHSLARKKAAAAALLAVINSAADNIHGGLYDEQRGSVVQVDGLLTLLGEATVFVDQPKRILSLGQCFSLIKAIEDLETVGSRIYRQCDQCFQSTMAASRGSHPGPSPQELLRQTVSNMTSSSGFSLVGSSMFDSEPGRGETMTESGSGSGSGILIQPGGTDGGGANHGGSGGSSSNDSVKRGWDWRNSFGREVKGEDVLRRLRWGLAKDITRAWVEGEES